MSDAIEGTVVEVHPDEPTPDMAPAVPTPAGQELAYRPTGSTELIHAASPRERIDQAREMASVLNEVIIATGARTKVGRGKVVKPDGTEAWEDRYHVNVEAWQTLATLLGVALVERHVRIVTDADGRPLERRFTLTKTTKGKNNKPDVVTTFDVVGHDWEAVVDAYKDGVLIASGSGLCSRSEATWAQRDEFSLRSMAVTRATSRAHPA